MTTVNINATAYSTISEQVNYPGESSWATFHDCSDTGLLHSATPVQSSVVSQNGANAYYQLGRGFLTFPISIPAGATVGTIAITRVVRS